MIRFYGNANLVALPKFYGSPDLIKDNFKAKTLTKSFMVTVDVTTLGSLTGLLGYCSEILALYSQNIF